MTDRILSLPWSLRPQPVDRPITFWLRCLVLACIAPALTAATLLMLRALDQERTAQVEATVMAARSLASAVDGELASMRSALEVLAMAPVLAAGDMASFHDFATRVAGRFGPAFVVLFDPSGRMIMTTGQPADAALPRVASPDVIRRVVASGRSAVTDLRTSPITGEPLLLIEVPVTVDGAIRHVLGMAIPPQRLQSLVRRDDLGADRLLSLLDGTGTIIARSEAAERYVGRKATPALAAAAARATEGALDLAMLDGTPAFAAHVRSSIAGWTAVAGVRTAPQTESRVVALWLAIVGAAALILVGTGLANLIARRIARAIDSLQDPALALSQGRRVADLGSGITEVTRVGRALQRMVDRLRHHHVEREHAARVARDAEAAARAAERLAALIEAAPDATLLLDARCTVRFANRRVADVFGQAPDAIKGHGFEMLLPPAEVRPARERLRQVFRTRSEGPVPASHELLGRRSDGETFPIEVTLSLITLDGEHHVMAAIRDVTARKRLEQEVETARAGMLAASRLSALGTMAGGVAHEINNPLAVIHGAATDLAEASESDTAPASEARETARLIMRMTTRIRRIVTSLRFLARDGEQDPFADATVVGIVSHALDVGAERFRASDVALRVNAIPEGLRLRCREVQLSQALMNLLQNAFDAARAGTAPGWIHLSVRAEPDGIAFDVSDSGAGVPPHLRERIMEPFVTTKPVGEGTGLGLSLSSEIARQHGGSVTLHGTAAGHTCFRLFVPHLDREERR